MGLFDIFKKKEKEPDYDVTNLTVENDNGVQHEVSFINLRFKSAFV